MAKGLDDELAGKGWKWEKLYYNEAVGDLRHPAANHWHSPGLQSGAVRGGVGSVAGGRGLGGSITGLAYDRPA